MPPRCCGFRPGPHGPEAIRRPGRHRRAPPAATATTSTAAHPSLLGGRCLADVVVPDESCAAQQEEKPDNPLAQARSPGRCIQRLVHSLNPGRRFPEGIRRCGGSRVSGGEACWGSRRALPWQSGYCDEVDAWSEQFGDPPRVSGNVRRSRKGCVRSLLRKPALALILAAGLGQGAALSQSPLPQTKSSLSRNPASVRDWADRLLAADPKVRATAEAALVKGRGVHCRC